MSSNIVFQNFAVLQYEREQLLKQKACLIWLTGLSGSGKSTLANALQSYLFKRGNLTFTLDGDNLRHGLNSDLDFSETGRKENLRRVGEVAKLMTEAGVIVITSFISPYKEDRDNIRRKFPEGNFYEIFVDCPIEICEKRDVKGLYAKARQGLIKDFTGISSPFEAPENPELVVETAIQSLEESLAGIVNFIEPKIVLS